MTLYEDLKWRGLIDNISSPDLINKLNNEKLVFYIGTDPTADSLHIGHFCTVIALTKRLQDYGHTPIVVAGGATGLIGDPKQNSERPMITKEEVKQNIQGIKNQIKKLLDSNIEIIDNFDWLAKMNPIDYLRDYGKHFNINYMLSKETVKKRLDIGITYTEFSYMILQAIDYLKLYEKYNCTLQIGGSDQWGNITSGLELIRKIHGVNTNCYALTSPLITKADGSKFGKTESGECLWLDNNKTSSYEMYQYFINIPDEKVIECLKKLTFLDKETIEHLESSLKKEPEKRLATKTLAYEIVKFIHGEAEAIKSQKTSEDVFNNKFSQDMPTIYLKKEELINQNIIDVLFKTQVVTSKSEARRLIEQKGIKLNQEIVNLDTIITSEIIQKDIVISKGKKFFVSIKIS